jgi:putative transposase
MRFQFIDDHRDEFPVTRMCKVLKVSRSGYYAWRTRPVSAREMANRKLANKIEAVYNESDGTYGSPRIHSELKAQGVVCGKNRIARLMMLRGLCAKQHKRYRATTKRNRVHRAAPNLLKRNFTTERPNRMTSDLTLTALRMALRQRQPRLALLHHSDQGSQYTDGQYQALLEEHGIRVSMNGAGTWYDNAPMESFFGTLKSERVHHLVYRAHQEARTDLFHYIEGFYNSRRRHSSLGYLSPADYEKQYYQRHGFA